MSKAYDRVEWSFVVGVLESMGFSKKLVKLEIDVFQRCPSKSSSMDKRPIIPLHVCSLNVCYVRFAKEVITLNIHRIQVARSALRISHLFFADDSILFARGNSNEAEKILEVLSIYQKASGQMVNLDKSEASFSRNVRDEFKQMIHNRMGVKIMLSQSRYLGLLVVKEVFSLVVEHIWKRMKGWKEGFLSRAGKEVLIKSVSQAIPSYITSCFKLPYGVSKDIERMLVSFWWGAKNGSGK
ncbi:uncharacterized protein LOC131615035 [Vicia villosa]|uniref:uncharacterized protein LOC131615035 n=1 Tax=Vicia villosa TaxID=3911 RepID=UPI00273A78E5|nr:uncharacterized protein LOC131615035 [Vicia villosa]